jgi:hypothetical protein
VNHPTVHLAQHLVPDLAAAVKTIRAAQQSPSEGDAGDMEHGIAVGECREAIASVPYEVVVSKW